MDRAVLMDSNESYMLTLTGETNTDKWNAFRDAV